MKAADDFDASGSPSPGYDADGCDDLAEYGLFKVMPSWSSCTAYLVVPKK